MSAELERRLVSAFRGPRPSARVEQRARRAALASLPPAARRDPTRLFAIGAAAAAALAIGAAALAASGQIHVRLGSPARRPPALPRRLPLPPNRSRGLAVVAGGRLWVVTAAGARLERFAASAATLSPRALYVAVGSGDSLVAMSPSGRTAWAQPTSGVVRSIAWAPDGIEIAYIVARPGHGNELHMIEGNGERDRLLASRVAAVTPSWRSDSLAIAFVDGRGRATVDDLARGTTRPAVSGRACSGRSSAVSFAPQGGRLAFVAGPVLATVSAAGRPSCLRLRPATSFADLAWAGSRLLLTAERGRRETSVLRSWRVGSTLRELGAGTWRGSLLGIDAGGGGRQFVVLGSPPAGGLQLGLLQGQPSVAGSRLSVRALWQVGARGPAHLTWR
ncbi:MAG TPA: hypothetical protein VF002_02405 [Gaiellaceae bacterium]